MFNPHHAWTALETADRLLLGPLGMRTLTEHDWAYLGDYNVEDDSEDPKRAHGFSYHNGPVRGGGRRQRWLLLPRGQRQGLRSGTNKCLLCVSPER